MTLIWADKVDDVDEIRAKDVNDLAHGIQSTDILINTMLLDSRPPKSTCSENQTLLGGATVNLMNVTGAGKINSIFLVLGSLSTYSAYTSRLKIYIDDNDTPVVDVPAQDFFFGRGFAPDAGNGTHWQSDRVGMPKHYVNSGDYRLGFYRYVDLAFKESCKITLSNGDGVLDLSYWCQIYYKNGSCDLDDFIGKYNVSYLGSAPGATTGRTTTPYEAVDLLNISSGAGKLESIWLTVYQNPGEPWIEGDFNIFIDGEATPSISSSGTEDFFMSAFAWAETYHSQNHGCVVREANGYTNVYRFLIPEGITFTNGIKVTWHAGEESQGAITGNMEIWSAVGYYLDF